MKELTEKEQEILLNLLLQEQNHINKQNGNIRVLLEDYKKDLAVIYQKLCDSFFEG